jgi:hypothetical protein
MNVPYEMEYCTEKIEYAIGNGILHWEYIKCTREWTFALKKEPGN